MDIDWQALMSSLLGGSLAVGVAKHFLTRTLDRIDAMPVQIAKMEAQLMSINIKLELLDRLHTLTHEHDKRIATLTTTITALEIRRHQNGAGPGPNAYS